MHTLFLLLLLILYLIHINTYAFHTNAQAHPPMFYTCLVINLFLKILVHGNWTDWIFGTCSKSCGGGIKNGFRTCSNPEPKHGGRNCTGPTSNSTECNTNPCPSMLVIATCTHAYFVSSVTAHPVSDTYKYVHISHKCSGSPPDVLHLSIF